MALIVSFPQETDGPDPSPDHDPVVLLSPRALRRLRRRDRPHREPGRLHANRRDVALLHSLVCAVDGRRGGESLHPAGSSYGCTAHEALHSVRLSCRLG